MSGKPYSDFVVDGYPGRQPDTAPVAIGSPRNEESFEATIKGFEHSFIVRTWNCVCSDGWAAQFYQVEAVVADGVQRAVQSSIAVGAYTSCIVDDADLNAAFRRHTAHRAWQRS